LEHSVSTRHTVDYNAQKYAVNEKMKNMFELFCRFVSLLLLYWSTYFTDVGRNDIVKVGQ